MGFTSYRVLSGCEVAWLTGGGVVHVKACLVLGKMLHCWAAGYLFDYLIGAGIKSMDPCADHGCLMGPWSKRLFEHGW